MSLAGMRNPFTDLPTVGPLGVLVDAVSGFVNHFRHYPDEWTVSTELALELSPDGSDRATADDALPVIGSLRCWAPRQHVAVLLHADVWRRRDRRRNRALVLLHPRSGHPRRARRDTPQDPGDDAVGVDGRAHRRLLRRRVRPSAETGSFPQQRCWGRQRRRRLGRPRTGRFGRREYRRTADAHGIGPGQLPAAVPLRRAFSLRGFATEDRPGNRRRRCAGDRRRRQACTYGTSNRLPVAAISWRR